MTRHFDILIIGAGPAGMAAAHAAASAASGLSIGLVDDNPREGGQIWRGGADQQPDSRAPQLWSRLQAMANVTFLPRTRLLYPLGVRKLLVQTAEDSEILEYERLILCTGARELLLPFPGWTLPGVTGAGGLQALAKGGYPVAGKRVVVAGTGPLLLAVAATLRQRGADIVAIVEQAPPAKLRSFAFGLLATPGKIAQALRLGLALRGVPYYSDSYVRSARSTVGGGALRDVELMRAGLPQRLECNLLACGYGLLPNLEVAMAFGCATDNGKVDTDKWQQTSVSGIYCAGEGTGVGGVDLALAEGRIAGLAASEQRDAAEPHLEVRSRWSKFAWRLSQTFALRPELRQLAADDTIVCRCEDVSHGELAQHASWRSAKLQTRCGMGPCQGRICGAATGHLYGWRPDAVRVPLVPARADSIIASIAQE